MYLVVDLTERNVIKLRLVSKDCTRERAYVGRNTDLLLSLDKFFKLCRIEVSNLLGVAVHTGEGSFTSVRVAITWANAFFHTTSRPVISLKSGDSEDFADLEKRFNKTPSAYVSATYASGPNISENRSLWHTIKQKVAN
ncbi:MAG TPA: hypothetical protein PLV72_03760 [Candidatus Magasanikbacteria bacterium]|nr:hypothetical protein [Candidatus Magasanikbacteria bacterium]